jgi:superfamily II DNA/RNA helicase
MAFVLQLVRRLVAEGHKTLVFSQSSRMLRMLRAGTAAMRISSLYLTGHVTKIAKREQIIHEFNSCPHIPLLFLTTGVGGVGITLTGADRVIIYDPSWNPATDAQAVDRAFRVGQTRPVLVYRLVTCGTVEEKILRNQIFKRGLHKMVLQQENQQRYFTKQQLRELFKLGPLHLSETHEELTKLHSSSSSSASTRPHADLLHQAHRQWLSNGEGGGGSGDMGVRGVSEHHLLFTKLAESSIGREAPACADLSATPLARYVSVERARGREREREREYWQSVGCISRVSTATD